LGSKIIIFGIAKKTKKSLFAFQNLGGELKRGGKPKYLRN
jgi:hypothetical protein